MVTNVTAVRIRLLDTVGLNISWIPREYTGPTKYRILLEEKSNVNGSIVQTRSDINFEALDNLLAYWDYNISIQAVTETGLSDWTKPIQVKTLANTPGFAAFTLIQDKEIATKVTINIQCPDEKNRNGTISKYIIYKLNMNNSNSENQSVSESIDCNRNTRVELNNILPEQTYSIRVLVENHEFNGTFSEPVYVSVQPKPPILDAPGKDTIKPSTVTTTSQVQITLCVECILNNTLTQGNLTDAGIIVCLDVPKSSCFSKRNKGGSVKQEGYNITWFESKEQNFELQYRTTPDDWLQALSNSSSSEFQYTIGSDVCKNERIFCNGHLPPGTTARLFLDACTDGGCSRSRAVEIPTLVNLPANTTPALIGGLVGGMLGLVLIFAVAIVVMYLKRQSVKYKLKKTELNYLGRLKMVDSLAISANSYSSPIMGTSYSHQYDVIQDNIYAQPKEVYDEIPPDYDYDDVLA